MDYFTVIRQRYSCRAYRPDMVEPNKMDRILECARLAPTAANRQAIMIIVIPTAGRQNTLQRIYARTWFVEAPYLICVCSIPGQSWVRSDHKSYADVDAAIVMDHMVLAATALGLGTCWVAAFDTRAAREILQLDQDWEPVAFTPLGYPDDDLRPKVRKPLAEIVVLA